MYGLGVAEDIQKDKEEQRKEAIEKAIYLRNLDNKESYHKDGSGCGKPSSNNSRHSRYSNYSYSYSYDFDPDDYDSADDFADDFADDAWGNFSDWDSAYDYWDNY